jgi:thiol-disulfide isomerase/thioredoxin
LGMSGLLPALDSSEAAPRFSAKTLAGEAFNNQSLMGKVVLVEFWATWCPYCRSDAEPLDDLAKEFEKDGLVVLAVDVAESKKTVKVFLERNPPRKVKVVLMADTNLAAKRRCEGCCAKLGWSLGETKTRRLSCGRRLAGNSEYRSAVRTMRDSAFHG